MSGTTIKRPVALEEDNSTQQAAVRTLAGNYHRDYFGANKRIWRLTFQNVNATDFATINTIYQNYLSTKTAVTFQSTETNYIIAQTSVHVDLLVRQFRVQGSDYLSDFTLTLTEA